MGTHLRSFAASSSGTTVELARGPIPAQGEADPLPPRMACRRWASSRKREGLSDITSTVQSGELAKDIFVAEFWRDLRS